MSERSVPDTVLEGVKYALGEVGKANITLKQKQEEILEITIIIIIIINALFKLKKNPISDFNIIKALV